MNKYPEGKLNEDDEGELEIFIGTEKNNVVISFGKPVSWLALPPDKAIGLALNIIKRAKSIDLTKSVEITL